MFQPWYTLTSWVLSICCLALQVTLKERKCTSQETVHYWWWWEQTKAARCCDVFTFDCKSLCLDLANELLRSLLIWAAAVCHMDQNCIWQMESLPHAHLIFMYSHISECLREEFAGLLRVVQLRSVYFVSHFSFFFFFFFPESCSPAEDLKHSKTNSHKNKIYKVIRGKEKVVEKQGRNMF